MPHSGNWLGQPKHLVVLQFGKIVCSKQNCPYRISFIGTTEPLLNQLKFSWNNETFLGTTKFIEITKLLSEKQKFGGWFFDPIWPFFLVDLKNKKLRLTERLFPF